MLTLAIDDPPVSRRSTLGDGLVRWAAATVLLASFIGVGYFAVFAWVDHSLFRAWQVILIAVVLGGMLIGLGLGSWFLLRSRHLARGRTSYLRLALLALVPGLVLGVWISAFVIGSVAISWIRHSSFGNPHGPGVTVLKSAPAPSTLASHMLAPPDLGSGWYNIYKPNPSLMPISAQETSEGQLVRVKDIVDGEYWDRIAWVPDGFALETLLRFDSATQAANHTAIWKAQYPGVKFAQQTIAQTVTLQGLTDTGLRSAVFVVGDDFYEVTESMVSSTPTVAQFQTVVTAAVAKATVTP